MREIVPNPSRLLGLLLLGMATLALAAIYLAAIPAVIQMLVGLSVIGLSVWGWQRARIMEVLRMTADGMLQCQNEQGEWRELEVLGDSLVSPALIVLRYRFETQRVRTQVLLPDSADAESLRRLRVSLRWARHTRSDTASRGTG
ncbi:MAG: protein YgfX [Thiobacillus sp.]